ncbi:hypothetical protein GCM10020254_76320 [Streptomyces goshikiensis]
MISSVSEIESKPSSIRSVAVSTSSSDTIRNPAARERRSPSTARIRLATGVSSPVTAGAARGVNPGWYAMTPGQVSAPVRNASKARTASASGSGAMPVCCAIRVRLASWTGMPPFAQSGHPIETVRPGRRPAVCSAARSSANASRKALAKA